MVSLELDTRVKELNGAYRGVLTDDWSVLTPNGGFTAALGLRAAAERLGLLPACVNVDFLRRAEAGPVDIAVEVLRESRAAAAVSVEMAQGDQTLCRLTAWFVQGQTAEPDHVQSLPDMGAPADVPSIEDRLGPNDLPFGLFQHIEMRPVEWIEDYPNRSPDEEPESWWWFRFRDQMDEDTPISRIAQLAILSDVTPFMAAERPHADWEPARKLAAQTLSLRLDLHHLGSCTPYLLVRAASPTVNGPRISGSVSIYGTSGALVASALSQSICRS